LNTSSTGRRTTVLLARQVVAVGPEAVDGHAPGQRTGHEHPAVRGQDAAEVRVGLEGGDEPIEPEGQDAGTDKGQAAVFADALPDQPGPADLGQGGQGKQQHRAQRGHGLTLPRRRALASEPGQSPQQPSREAYVNAYAGQNAEVAAKPQVVFSDCARSAPGRVRPMPSPGGNTIGR
jgi:hypothetical protein